MKPVVITFFLLYVTAYAQVRNGAVTGTVTTSWELAVEGANVTLTNRQTGAAQTAISSKDGEYRFPTLTPGVYDVSVSADGFTKYLRQNIPIGDAGSRMVLRLQTDKDVVAGSVKQWEAATEAKPDDYMARFNLGRAYLAAGNVDKAGEEFSKVVEQHADFVPARLGIAQIALRRGDATGAFNTALEVLKLKPDSGLAKIVEAASYLRSRQFAESEGVLKELIKDDPMNTDAMIDLGTTELALKKYSEAEEAFRRAYTLEPSNVRGLTGVSQTHFMMNEPEKAVQAIAAEVDKEPKRRELRKELAAAEFRAKQYDKAIADDQAILDQYKDSPVEEAGILARIGEAYQQTGDLERGIDNLKKATELAPDQAGFLTSLAGAYDRAGKKPEAISEYRAALKIEPNNALVMNNLAYALANSGGDLNEALDLAQQARRQFPRFNDILDTIGWIYLKMGLTDSAVRTFRDLVEKSDKNPTYHFHYGVALMQKGDKAGALKELNAALERNPGKEEETAIKEAIRKTS